MEVYGLIQNIRSIIKFSFHDKFYLTNRSQCGNIHMKGGALMNRIVKILMERDDMTEAEATELLNEVREMILENSDSAEDVVLEELGLEMDYIFDII